MPEETAVPHADILAQVSDAVVFADLDGVIRLWNPACVAVFGFTEAEAIGRNLDLIIPENLRQAHWQGFTRAVQSGVMRLGGQATMTRALHRDGRRIYVELSFALVRSASGSVVGAAAVARDATARFEADKALRQRLRDLSGSGT